MTSSLLAKAQAALVAARADPKSALREATEVVAADCTDEEKATAHFAIGLANRTLANGTESTAHLERGAHCAALLPELRGRILRSLAFNYAQAGQHERADATIAESIDLLDGAEQGLSRLQQAFMLLMRGEHRLALPILTDAVAAFSKKGEDENLQLTLYNRALIHMELGDYDASVADLERAYEIAEHLGHDVFAADCALHLSQVLGWRDEVPAAMEWHARSVELRSQAGAENPVADTEHAFVLIQARLMREAEAVLRNALPRLVAAGHNEAIAVQGHLLLAAVLSDRGDHRAAAEEIRLAKAASPADGRFRFDIAAAEHENQIAAGAHSTELLQLMIATAHDMEANGERHAAATQRFRAVEVALALGDVATAAKMCDDTARYVRDGPLWLQIQAWTALASVRMALGNRRGAAAAVQAGFRRLDEYRSGIGATELRLHAADYGRRLAGMGLELAIASGSIARVFSWAERLRATPQRTGNDPDAGLKKALAQFRQNSTWLRTAEPDRVPELRRSQRKLERTVRDLARRHPGSARQSDRPTLDQVRDRLDSRALIEMLETSGSITAVVATPYQAQLVDLGPARHTTGTLDQLRLAAERIARPSTSPASRGAALDSARQLANELHRALLAPIAGLIGSRRPVIVPTGSLHGIPWGHIFDGPVEVAPSATSWVISRTAGPTQGASVVVAGPGLQHAAAESVDIAAISGARTVSSMAEALGDLAAAQMAHFACHARPRVDNPMFSSLVLADGELTLYDIEQLDGVPSMVVLAACDGGSAALASGDEVLGLASAFLAVGAKTVVAPLFTVSDAATAAVMGRFHRALASGHDAAAALSSIRNSEDPVAAFTARSFTCFGAA